MRSGVTHTDSLRQRGVHNGQCLCDMALHVYRSKMSFRVTSERLRRKINREKEERRTGAPSKIARVTGSPRGTGGAGSLTGVASAVAALTSYLTSVRPLCTRCELQSP